MQNIIQLSCLKHEGHQIEMLDIGKSTQIGLRTLFQTCFDERSSKNDVIFLKHFYEKLNQQKQKEFNQIETKKEEYNKKLSPLFKYLEEAQKKCVKIFEFAQTEFQQLQSNIISTLSSVKGKLDILGQNPTISQLQELAEKISKGDQLVPIDFSVEHEKVVTNRQQNHIIELSKSLQEIFKEILNIFSYLDNKNINDYIQAHQTQIKHLCQSIGVNCRDNILAISENNDISIWNLDNYQFNKIDLLKGHLEKVTCIQFSLEQNWFVSGSDDQTLKIWKMNMDSWCCIQTLKGHQNYISDIKISYDENTIISSSFDFEIRIWQQKDQKNWFCSQTLDNHKNYVYYLSINRSNTFFASSSQDYTLKIWQVKNKKWEINKTIEKKQNEWIKRICFVNDNQIACQVVGQPKVMILEITGNNEVTQMQEISLTENDDEYSYNPMIYFQKKRLIILKNKNKILIIRERNNRLFQLINTINGNYQGPTLNITGRSLIMFEKDKKQLQLFKAY